ncbi:MAG: Lin0512 family protein [Pseudomonadota bacterium]
MTHTRVALQIGHGTSLRRADYTAAGRRAIEAALWRNSLSVGPAFGMAPEEMVIDAEVAVQQPDAVDTEALAGLFPYGQVTVRAVFGGLDIAKLDGDGVTVVANAAVTVSLPVGRL